ncbi:MAG TPA: DNA primase catalytic subunit PriS [Thermoplasmatales archaeon]|nr:DNA primase catalytic subunit PriS [Thermoplasmatales archaeon]
MNKESTEFIKRKFKNYYENADIPLPDRFSRREYAFMLFREKGMIRHISFKRKQDFLSFIVDKTPAHIYYSSAYYKYPYKNTMDRKEWMGAELIFDLDADHIPGADKLSYEEALENVKTEFIKLVKDFLLNDFGFNTNELHLYFSGSRGYHCHVVSPRVLNLDSSARREIVDYIMGNDLRYDIIFKERIVDRISYGKGYQKRVKRLEIPRADEAGWRGRISKTLLGIINEIKNLDREDAITKLKSYGITQRMAEKVIDTISDEKINRIKEGMIDQSSALKKLFLKSALRKIAVSLSAGETDEPVTCDTKRLIRLPYSLHGKTGFQVKGINIDELKFFNPLRDAVIFGDKQVKVKIKQPVNVKIKDEHYKLNIGEDYLPEYLAVFLIGRGYAEIWGD